MNDGHGCYVLQGRNMDDDSGVSDIYDWVFISDYIVHVIGYMRGEE